MPYYNVCIQLRVVHLLMRDTLEQRMYERSSDSMMTSSQTTANSITGVQVSPALS